MKAVLEFNLPEEQEEHDLAIKAHGLSLTIYDMDNWLRNKLKYESDSYSSDQLKVFELARDRLRELAGDQGIDYLVFG